MFILLLLLVIFSFVLYLSQGSSIFDLLPDPNREKQEFYGYDWNDPDQRRFLSITNRVAADFGVVAPPTADVFEEADQQFMQNLQGQLQQAFQANREDVDQQALQRLFGFMQAWPNFPKELKVREIARSGAYDTDFSESTVKAKVSLDGQADSWNFLPMDVNHPMVNQKFSEFVSGIDPNLGSEANRSQALQFVGKRHGFSPREVESVLFSHFRTSLIDQVYGASGFALGSEAELDLHNDSFAWDGEILEVKKDASNKTEPEVMRLEFGKTPSVGQKVTFHLGAKPVSFIFGKKPKDDNSSDTFVELAPKLAASIKNFQIAVNQANIGVRLSPAGQKALSLKLSSPVSLRSFPRVSTDADELKVVDMIGEKIRNFFEERKADDGFAQEPRTFASAIVFASAQHYEEPVTPDEGRMRSYFDRNRLDFLPAEEEEKGVPGPEGAADADQSISEDIEGDLLKELANDANSSEPDLVKFEDVKDEVRKRILKSDREEAKRESERLARDQALEFLEAVHQMSDQFRSGTVPFSKLRQGEKLTQLITQSGGSEKKISFTDEEMNVQAMVLGLEKRESERRANKEALSEVSQLTEKLFFTRSVRKTRDGYAVFLLNNKTERRPGEFDQTPFHKIYKKYIEMLEAEKFSTLCNQTLKNLEKQKQKPAKFGSHYSISAKNANSARASFDRKQRKISAEIQKLEQQKSDMLAKESNSTAKGKQSTAGLDAQIQKLRDQQSNIREEQQLVSQLLDAAPTLPVGGEWTELKRTEQSATFVRLSQVYTLRKLDSAQSDLEGRERDLELARAESTRDGLISSLIDSKLGD